MMTDARPIADRLPPTKTGTLYGVKYSEVTRDENSTTMRSWAEWTEDEDDRDRLAVDLIGRKSVTSVTKVERAK
jgi:hypothetical protein